MHKVAVVGQGSVIEIFKLVGCEIFIVKNKNDAVRVIKQLIFDQFALIFLTSSLAAQIEKELKKYSFEVMPIISQIPG